MDEAGWDEVEDAVAVIRAESRRVPRIALILGSGLGRMAGEVEDGVSIPYGEIPHFATSTAPGHRGALILGTLEGVDVLVYAGRVHMYEGYEAARVALPVRVAAALGAEVLIVTNAAGGVNLGYHPGLLMVIGDHINLTGRNPLAGPNDPRLGVRFPDMSEAYDSSLRRLAHEVARAEGVETAEGVYLGLLGPNYETPAEIRMCRTLGADAVGMSTVVEVLAAGHLGMRVLGISCITNMAAGILPQRLTETEVIETGEAVAAEFGRLVRGVVRGIAPGLST